MTISARVASSTGQHKVMLQTDQHQHFLNIPPTPEGFGSSVNGGELLFLALATCYCNDLYREARKRGIQVEGVEVEVSGEFGGEGEGASNITYRASVASLAPEEEILSLMRHTDTVAEIHNTLRNSTQITLADCEARKA